MRTIKSISELDIPYDYQNCIMEYLENTSCIPFISRVILYGSCAKEAVTTNSDIDIFVITSREISTDEEIQITYNCYPERAVGNIPMDMIVQNETAFNSYTNSFGMVQKQIVSHGVDLSGLLR